MMVSIGYLILFGMLGNILFKTFRLPGLIGMLVVGIVIGPQGLNLLSDELLMISGDLRKIALIIILLRAGLGLNLRAIRNVGKVAGTMSVIPVVLEGLTIIVLAVILLEFTFVQAGMLGFVVAAVSPAVIVPSMLRLIREKVGMKRNVPVLVLASASIDDVIAITVFSMFLSAALTQTSLAYFDVFMLPIAIFLGVLFGIIVGLFLVGLFKKFRIRDSKKVLILISVGIMMVSFTELIEDYIFIASLLGVMTLGLVIVERRKEVAERLTIKFDKVWVLAELFLFVLVGAAVDINIALSVGIVGLFIICVGLLARGVGVFIATLRTDFVIREKWFLFIAFIPKATVQAAMGSLPMVLGLPGGEVILAISVLSILVTAPLGALLIQIGERKLLDKEDVKFNNDELTK